MGVEINVAEILKDKPQGTKLYADAFGELEYCGISNDKDPRIFVEAKECTGYSFYNNGKYNKYGEPILFPSKEMRDWSKFSWKKGDVLVSRGGTVEVIFDGFDDDDYVTFKGKHALKTIEGESEYKGDSDDGYDFYTENYHLESEDAAQTYINTIEERLGGKLNRETLEIEKTQPEFKDGDILYCEGDSLHFSMILILKILPDKMQEYAYMVNETYDWTHICCDKTLNAGDISRLRYATEEEKQHLFNAIAKKGKQWDAEKKMIVDLKPKCEFKPFDKVLGRNEKDDVWEAELFSHYREESQYPFRCIGFSRKYCIPYNEDTKHLLGTTDEWKGGER